MKSTDAKNEYLVDGTNNLSFAIKIKKLSNILENTCHTFSSSKQISLVLSNCNCTLCPYESFI